MMVCLGVNFMTIIMRFLYKIISTKSKKIYDSYFAYTINSEWDLKIPPFEWSAGKWKSVLFQMRI